MKGIRQELSSMLTVLAVPISLAFVFPYGSLNRTSAGRHDAGGASSAFVELTPHLQELALRAAKTSWQADSVESRRWHADLYVGDLPDDQAAAPIELAIAPARSAVRLVGYEPEPHPDSLAAPAVKRRAERAAAVPSSPVFPKDELLKIE